MNTTAKKSPARTAAVAHAEHLRDVRLLLETLQTTLASKGTPRDLNWGHVGDLEYLSEELTRLVAGQLGLDSGETFVCQDAQGERVFLPKNY